MYALKQFQESCKINKINCSLVIKVHTNSHGNVKHLVFHLQFPVMQANRPTHVHLIHKTITQQQRTLTNHFFLKGEARARNILALVSSSKKSQASNIKSSSRSGIA